MARPLFEPLTLWWLERFSDIELCAMAFAFDCEVASAETVAAWRERLRDGLPEPAVR
jgi:hypothetical protein